jgi:hypothetical protein
MIVFEMGAKNGEEPSQISIMLQKSMLFMLDTAIKENTKE